MNKIFIKKQKISSKLIIKHTLNFLLSDLNVLFICSEEKKLKIWDTWDDLMYGNQLYRYFANVKFFDNFDSLEVTENTLVFILDTELVSYGNFHKYLRKFEYIIAIGDTCPFQMYPGIKTWKKNSHQN
jgi:hypothetical protein